MDTTILDRAYAVAQQTTSFAIHNEFLKKLLSMPEPEAVEYHYNLLHRRENRELYLRVRAAFEKRGRAAEVFMLSKLSREPDTDLQADILLMLGLMRSLEARRIALDFIPNESPKLRHFACLVLGWVGTEQDLAKLGKILLEDVEPRVRGTASTALRQMWYRIPVIKNQLPLYLMSALEKETDEQAQQEIIIVVQELLNKKLGLKENTNEGTITGETGKAAEKARALLTALAAKGELLAP